jgi:hypothetical protein
LRLNSRRERWAGPAAKQHTDTWGCRGQC